MRLLLDTNVLIDHISHRAPFCEQTEELCIASYFGDVELWVSVQSFLDALYALRKWAPQAKLREAMVASLEFFRPCGVLADDLKPALLSEWPDAEDFIISRCAKNIDADYLVTRDEEGFKGSAKEIITPMDAVLMLHEQGFEYGLVKTDTERAQSSISS